MAIPDPIHVWKLDGDANDGVGSIDGTIYGAASSSTGKNNYSYYFDGGNDYISFGDVLDSVFAGDFTISFWVRCPVLFNAQGHFMSKWYDGTRVFSLGISSYGGTLFLAHTNTTGNTGYNTTYGGLSWNTSSYYHVVFVKDTDVGKIVYTDGTERINVSTPQASSNNAPFIFGAEYNNSVGNYIRMYLSDVYIWDEVLTSTQVTELYNSGDGLFYPFSSSGWSGKVNGISSTSIAKVNGMSISGISKIGGA